MSHGEWGWFESLVTVLGGTVAVLNTISVWRSRRAKEAHKVMRTLLSDVKQTEERERALLTRRLKNVEETVGQHYSRIHDIETTVATLNVENVNHNSRMEQLQDTLFRIDEKIDTLVSHLLSKSA